MQAELKLSQKEIEEAVKLYIQQQGWSVSSVKLEINLGYSDMREYQSPSVTAVCAVSGRA